MNDVTSATYEGTFWAPAAPESKVPGSLTHEVEEFVVVTQGYVFRSAGWSQTAGGWRYEGSARNTALDHLPRVLHGEVDGDGPVTLLDAQMTMPMSFRPPYQQRFTGFRLLRGAHVEEADVATGVRWTMNLGGGVGWADAAPVDCADGVLSAWAHGGWPGLQVELNEPLPIDAAADHVPLRIGSFLQLDLSSEVVSLRREVRLADGQWYVFGREDATAQRAGRGILDQRQVTLEMLARWADASRTLGRYPMAVMSKFSPIEVAGQVYMTCLEGLSNALPSHHQDIVTPSQRKTAKKAAVDAALDALRDTGVDVDVVRKQYQEALAHVGEPTYSERVEALLSPVFDLVPPLFGGDLEAWVDQAKKIRNQESHGSEKVHHLAMSELVRYIVMASTAQWAMRLRLLLEAVGPDTLYRRLGSSSAFWHLLGNTDADQLWEDYDCTAEFARANQVQGLLDELDAPPTGWPAWVLWATPDGPHCPPDGSCAAAAPDQRYAHAFLRLQGVLPPPAARDALATSTGVELLTWEKRRDLDLVLAQSTGTDSRTRAGVVIKDQILHLDPRTARPAVSTPEAFTSQGSDRIQLQRPMLLC